MIYEYRCSACNRVIEQEYKIGIYPPSITCTCGGVATRIISKVHVVVPYEFKSVKPYEPQRMDYKRETEEICRKRGENPAEYI